jgi:hypothetical protein
MGCIFMTRSRFVLAMCRDVALARNCPLDLAMTLLILQHLSYRSHELLNPQRTRIF